MADDEAALRFAPGDIVAPPSDPGYDALVVAAGRRGRRRRAATAAGVVFAVVAVTALVVVGIARRAAPEPFTPPGPPLTSCVPGPLTPPIDGGTTTFAVDPTSRYAFGTVDELVANTEGRLTQVIFDNGVAYTALYGFEPLGVNSRGWAVGAGNAVVNSVGPQYPALYRDGRLSRLPLPAGYVGGAAQAINTRGDIVGSVARDGDSFVRVPVLWPADHPRAVVMLPLPSSARTAEAMSINDDRVIGGQLEKPHRVPYLWTSPSSGHPLAVPAGMDGGDVWIVRGNYAVGHVTRHVFDGQAGISDPDVSAEWNLRSGEVRVHPGHVSGLPTGVDAAGAYVINESSAGPSLLVQPGRPDITVPAPPEAVGRYPYIDGMSADGHRLVGHLVNRGGGPTSGPITWTCS